MLKKDNLKFGLLLGFIVPLFSLVIYYFVKFYPLHVSASEFFRYVTSQKNLITAISVPCLFLNIALFTFYINSRLDKTAKGIFAVTLVYAIVALLFKFIL